MKNFTKIKKFFSQNNLFNLLILLLILATIGVGVKFFTRKEQWLAVEMWGTGGEWWWNTGPPPYWVAEAIQVGDAEYDAGGKKIAEVLEIKKYGEYDKKKFWLKAKLKVSTNPKTGKIKYRNEDLEIGRPLTIKLVKNSLTGNVTWIEGIKDTREEQDLEITLKLYSRYPWVAEAIKIGDEMTDESGEIAAKILDKKIELAEMTVVTDWGEVLARRDPLKRDITLKMRIKTVKVSQQSFFTNIQEVKIGNSLFITMPKINFEGSIIDIGFE